VIELKAKPRRVRMGDQTRIKGTGFPPGKLVNAEGHDECLDTGHNPSDDKGETVLARHVHDCQLRVTVSYPDRSEGTKTLVAWDGHPRYKPGEIDFTLRAERPGKALVQVWDWAGMHVLGTTIFTVVE